jgi:anaerobic ribonucleoside-triphosphate reductase activating protein
LTVVNLGGINALSTNDTDGIAVAIFFQGCPFNCYKCHNPELQAVAGGKQTTTNAVMQEIVKNIEWYDCAAFMGGEPLAQKGALIDLLKRTKELGLRTWLYTGFEIDNVPNEVKTLCDVIVAGQYVDELRTGGFPASSNQKVLFYGRVKTIKKKEEC